MRIDRRLDELRYKVSSRAFVIFPSENADSPGRRPTDMSTSRLLYLLGLVCILISLFGGSLVHRLAGSSSGSTAMADGFELVWGVAALLFILRARSAQLKDSTKTAQPSSEHRTLYVIVGGILAVCLFVAVLFLTGGH